MCKVSVIIPNYNHAEHLSLRINSIISQKFTDYEIIILDDASNDHSQFIIELYRSNKKIKNIVYNSINSGSPFKQWIKGFELASGSFIWIAESDDYCAPEFLSSIMQIFNDNPNVDLVYAASTLINHHGVEISQSIREVSIPSSLNYYCNSGQAECIHYQFHSPIVPNSSAVVFKKKLLTAINFSFQNYRMVGDWQFWADMFYHSNLIVYYPIPLNFNRISQNSISKSDVVLKDSLRIFLLERLDVAIYIRHLSGNSITKSERKKMVIEYLSYMYRTIYQRKGTFINFKDYILIFNKLTQLYTFAVLYGIKIFLEIVYSKCNKLFLRKLTI